MAGPGGALSRRLRHHDPRYTARLLAGPGYLRLTDVLRMASRRPSTAGHVRALLDSEWIGQPRVRRAIVENPFTPGGVAASLLMSAGVESQRHLAAFGSAYLRDVATKLGALRG